MSPLPRAVALVPGAIAGIALAVYGWVEGGAVGAIAAVVATSAMFALALFWGDSTTRAEVDRGFATLLAVLPGALVIYLGFQEGGFFAADTGLVVVLLAAALLTRTVVSRDPFEGADWPAVVAGAALAGFAGWTLASGSWSGVPARALMEADRALAYLLALLLFTSIPRSALRLRWMLRGLAVGILVVCVAGLVSRVLPELLPTQPSLSASRLSYPITYWNALGLLAALGVLFCLHGTSDAREPPAGRVLAAGAIPPLAATLFFTVSRGAVLAVVGGFVAYLLLGRPRLALSALAATALPCALVLRSIDERTLLFSTEYASPTAVAQGAGLAREIVVYAVIASVARAVLLALDTRLVRFRLPDRARRPVVGGAWAVAALAVLVTALALDAPSHLEAQYERVVSAEPLPVRFGSAAGRLADPTDPSRILQWSSAVEDFRSAPLAGRGAGSWEVSWLERGGFPAKDAHSLYLEVAGELGAVGLALLALTLLAALATMAVRVRGQDRALYAIVLAGSLTWCGRAAIDWDWEMPGVTLWLFAVGGAALAAPPRAETEMAGARARRVRRGPGLRVTVAVAAVLAAAPALAILRSEDRLEVAQQAFAEGDCVSAVAAARASLAAVERRPEPREVLGLCASRFGLFARGVKELERAVALAPCDWRFQYSLALARGAAGLDPRREIRAALRLNPLDSQLQDAERRLATTDRRTWRREGLTAELHGASNG